MKFFLIYKGLKSFCTVIHVMNYVSDIDSDSSGPAITSENNKAIKEIQDKLKELVPSLHNSINLTTIKDLESRISNLEQKVDQILKTLESRKIN